MRLPVAGPWLDFCVLAVIHRGDTYGYELNQKLAEVLDLSESTLYPVLRRLQKDGKLTTYDRPTDGRNRRYYSMTVEGEAALDAYKDAWKDFEKRIDELLGGEAHD